MSKLLCVTPWPGSKSSHGRIPAELIPLWKDSFEEVGVWSIHGGPADGELPFEVDHVWHGTESLETRLPQLGQVIEGSDWTHIWIMGDLQFLLAVTSMGLVYTNLPDKLIYAYAIIDSPFIDTKYAQLPKFFDFFVTMSGMALGALTETVAELGSKVGKELFKSAMRSRTIRPGVASDTFRPMDVHRGEPSYEEIREVLFGNRVNSQDLLIMVSGQKTLRKGIPQACAIAKELQSLLKNGRKVKIYFHMFCRSDEQRPLRLDVIAAGCGLDPLTDVLYGDGFFSTPTPSLPDEDLNLIYNAVDLVLCTDLRNGWCFTATEAMAAGTLVAAPDEHVWLDVVGDRGIELPCTEFTWAPWGHGEYTRSVDPHAAALRIAEVVNDPEEHERRREACFSWAHSHPDADWSNSAGAWLELFGIK